MSTREKPNSCIGCPLYDHGRDFSKVTGQGSLKVMAIAEASGEMEAREQRPLVEYAPAGSLFERTLRRMSLSREQFSVTNICRCRPRNNFLSGAPWEHRAISQCKPNLDAAVQQYQPRCLFAMGDVPLRELTGMAGKAQGVGHLRGYVLPSRYRLSGGEGLKKRTPCECVPKNVLRDWTGDEVQPRTEDEYKRLAAANKPDPNCFLCGGLGYTDDWGDGFEGRVGETLPLVASWHPAFIRRGKAAYQGMFARDLNRAVRVAQGLDTSYIWDVDAALASRKLNYELHPSVEDAEAVYHILRDNPSLTISFDIETYESASLDEDARDGFQDTNLRLIQFAWAPGSAIAMPWENGFRSVAQRILALPNVKVGHNVWLFDNKVLEAVSAREGRQLVPRGVVHDTLQMFHYWQPDLPAHLQAAASFCNFPFPWKHLGEGNLPLYGCVDVDATLRLYQMLEATMKKEGLWDDQSYCEVASR